MPREFITNPDTDFIVSVGWDRNGNVQVATLNTLYEDPSVEAGWYVEVNRSEINDLIRLLRKARDGAFGRDE
jgi:hypothetical protein